MTTAYSESPGTHMIVLPGGGWSRGTPPTRSVSFMPASVWLRTRGVVSATCLHSAGGQADGVGRTCRLEAFEGQADRH